MKAMSNDGLARASAALALELPDRMAGHAPRRKNAWEEDYGTRRRAPAVDAARSAHSFSGDSHGDRNPVRKDRPDFSRNDDPQNRRQGLWRAVRAEFCPGTLVFLACLAVTAFIVVV